jgi:peptidoglycan/xylan/chitin deacetylase (PgdA/CDA1 family)
MDDIAPGMDWGRFWAVLQLFRRHGIKPLLGVVPDNRDQNLARHPPYPHFWQTLQELVAADEIDVAQHGYQHILVHRPKAAILGPAVGIRKAVSEFAGDAYSDQLFRIREGQRILQRNGIETKYWMAPNHSYDKNTLRALRESGFTAISDGIALFPYIAEDLAFVPQTSWKARWMPLGIHTVCLHTNTVTPRQIKQLRLFLRRPFHFTRFSSVVRTITPSILHTAANQAYSAAYKTAWGLRKMRAGARIS